MGKKRLRKKVVSKGKHSSISRALAAATRAERDSYTKHMFKIDAWKNLKNPWITIENPNKSQTNRPFIKVRADDYFGSPRPSQDSKESRAE
jgi:hypothetical protein